MRIVSIYVCFAACMVLLILRLLSIISGDYAQISDLNNTMSLTLDTSRGTIFDRNGDRLVNARTRKVAVVKPTALAASQLSEIVGADRLAELYERLSKGYPVSVEVEQPVDCSDICTVTLTDRYSSPQPAAHIIGYLGQGASLGVSGIEKSFDKELSELNGTLTARFSADALGKVLAGSEIQIISDNYYAAGSGVTLTLDIDIQLAAEKALDEAGVEKGAAVVTDASTGEILASVSRPAFDPDNLAACMNDPRSPFLNRAFSAFAPGSVFKLVVAAAALEQGIDENTVYCCTGSAQYSGVTFNCHEKNGHGKLDLRGAVMFSCNTYFMNLCQMLDIDETVRLAESMGLGVPAQPAKGLFTDSGTLTSAASLDSPGARANFSFGQGSLTVTPLQLAGVFGCIANGGRYVEPTLVAAQRARGEQVISPVTAQKLLKYLTATVEEGTGKAARPSNGTAAGKTATAQTGSFSGERELLNSWFAGCVPAEKPKYVIVVLKEDGVSGASDCAPVFRSIAEYLLENSVSAEKKTKS